MFFEQAREQAEKEVAADEKNSLVRVLNRGSGSNEGGIERRRRRSNDRRLARHPTLSRSLSVSLSLSLSRARFFSPSQSLTRIIVPVVVPVVVLDHVFRR